MEHRNMFYTREVGLIDFTQIRAVFRDKFYVVSYGLI